MNACLHASALGASSNLSVGGEARWSVRRKGTACERVGADAPGREVARVV